MKRRSLLGVIGLAPAWLSAIGSQSAAIAVGNRVYTHPKSSQPPKARLPMVNDSAIEIAGQRWVVQSGTPAGISVGTDLSVRAQAKAGEHASFDEGRQIRAEICGQRRYAKGETIHIAGAFTIEPETVIAGADWCSVVQIHQADCVRADSSAVSSSPLFSLELTQAASGLRLRVRGETSTGVPAPNVFPPQRVLGMAPITLGAEHAFDLTVIDGHGSTGRIALLIDGKTVCDFTGPTGYEYVDLLANPTANQQPVGSYLKIGVYAGKGSGLVPPAGVSVTYTFRNLTA